jgi:hypothetical protein
MAFTVFACETVTGRNLGPLDCAVKSWARVLNGGETASISLPVDLDGAGLNAGTRGWYRQITEPARMSIVIDWDGIALWAGPIWNRAAGAAGVDMSAAGLGSILTRRKLADPLSSTAVPNQTFAYSGLSLATIAKRLVQFSLARPGGTLPVVLPADESDGDGTRVRNYAGSDLNSIGQLITNLTGVIGGPDIDFRPQWVDAARTRIQWLMITGTAMAPKITSSSQLAFESGAPEGNVRALTVAEDASGLTTDQWAKGSGSGPSTMISRTASRALPDLGWPLLEGEADHTDVTTPGTLDAYTAGDLAANSTTVSQWGLTVDAMSDPKLGSYALGDLPTVHVTGHFWIPDGTYPMRIVQISGDSSTAVKLDVQPSTARALNIPGSPGDTLPVRVAALERAALQS